MPAPIDDRRPPITPQLAVRVAVLGGVAFVLFAIIFFRLWFLQVLTGDDYVVQARENRVRKVKIEAPRGNIVDRDGKTLVKTRAAPVVQILPNSVPDAELDAAETYRKLLSEAEGRRLAAARDLRELERRLRADGRDSRKVERVRVRKLRANARRADKVAVGAIPADARGLRGLYKRLGKVIGLAPATIHRRVIEGIADQPSANVTIKTDVPPAAFNYLLEHREEFHGVVVEKKYLRHYPFKTLGAQLFGTLREISPDEVGAKEYRGVSPGTRIGKDGIEESYDKYLRGTDGFTRVIVNSFGNRDDTRRTTRTDPIQGRQLRLTLDLGLQRAAQNAVARAIDAAHGNGNPADAGAFVAMDPRDGEVLALGSYPSFDANLFAKPIDQETYEQLNSEENGAPLFNRAISAGYPTGSTFKPMTAFAAVDSGIITPSTVLVDGGVFEYGGREFKNAGDAVFGSLALSRALQVSSDVFFYKLGAAANERGPIIQEWARKLSFGAPTGIDLPGEYGGLVPDAKWRNSEYDKYLKCAKKAKVPTGTTEALYACGGIERGWSGGDNVNLAVGQGDLQATPLQLATAYAAIANGGRVVTPHLGKQVEDGAGRQLEEIRKPAKRRVDIDPTTLEAIRSGLRAAASEGGGTSVQVF
jgi:penicillin-binding protein 2